MIKSFGYIPYPRLSARALIKFLKKISPKLPKIGTKIPIFSRTNRVQWTILHRINCDTRAFMSPHIGYFKKLVLWGALIRGGRLFEDLRYIGNHFQTT